MSAAVTAGAADTRTVVATFARLKLSLIRNGVRQTTGRTAVFLTTAVFVVGIGGLGHLGLQYARIFGATTVAVDVEDEKLQLAKDLGARRIAVNVLAPGATATDFAGGGIRDSADYRAMILPTVAMGRIGEPDDVGAAVAGILDPRLGWVTAQRIEASGGQRL